MLQLGVIYLGPCQPLFVALYMNYGCHNIAYRANKILAHG